MVDSIYYYRGILHNSVTLRLSFSYSA